MRFDADVRLTELQFLESKFLMRSFVAPTLKISILLKESHYFYEFPIVACGLAKKPKNLAEAPLDALKMQPRPSFQWHLQTVCETLPDAVSWPQDASQTL